MTATKTKPIDHICELERLEKIARQKKSEWSELNEQQKEAKKAHESARDQVLRYIKEIKNPPALFQDRAGKAETNGKPNATPKEEPVQPEELKPVWPFPLPSEMREATMEMISKHEKVKGISKTLLVTLKEKQLTTAGKIEGCFTKVACDSEEAQQQVKNFCEMLGQRNGALILNGLLVYKNVLTQPTMYFDLREKDGDVLLHDVAISIGGKRVNNAVLSKLASSQVRTLRELADFCGTDTKKLHGIIGPGPAKKLVEVVKEFLAQ